MHLFTIAPNISYTGSDATAEIIIMLVGAAIIGYLARIFVERFGLHDLVVARPVASAPAAKPVSAGPDDLTIVEGIGPKASAALKAAGVTSFALLAASTPAELRAILDAHGDRFAFLTTDTWPKQAALARDGKYFELDSYKKRLYAGIER
jgi:hypothetical protein